MYIADQRVPVHTGTRRFQTCFDPANTSRIKGKTVRMKISIIIPTRERAIFLAKSVRTATDISDDNIEIVVSDNASRDDTRDVIAAVDDPRIVYVNTTQRVSMRQNFEFALEKSSGDYVIFFGDDDGILPGQFHLLREILQSHTPDALSWDFPVYGWPSEGYGSKTGGLRFIGKKCFGPLEQLDRDAKLKAVATGRMRDMYPMPSIYHGCMSREFLDTCATSDGHRFAARSPDVYMNFRALVRGGRFIHMAHPFSINGYSKASTGGSLRDVGQKAKTKQVADTFLSESSVDPVDDVMPISMSMSLAFLGTFETVRHLFPNEPVATDYENWFKHALTDQSQKTPEVAAQIETSLNHFAAALNAQDALERARAAGGDSRLKRLQLNYDRFREKVDSFRLSAELDGENTILTAARVCDRVLGQDAASVYSGDLSRATAWRNARNRSRDFTRQL
ncbi:glycosyltransferase family 2 protein [Aestuariivita sp.]|uniref:glycosyltransferase family 2 protein n=1 Tax=Aestuariivita sp. TaxID=1872407 RepID=UPI003BB1944A